MPKYLLAALIAVFASCGTPPKKEKPKNTDCVCNECTCDLDGKCECKKCDCEACKQDGDHDESGDEVDPCDGGDCHHD